MSFRLVPKSVTLNDLERRNGRYFGLFQRIRVPATWYGGRPRLRRLCSMGTSYLQKKGTLTPPNFWPMSIVAKWLDG